MHSQKHQESACTWAVLTLTLSLFRCDKALPDTELIHCVCTARGAWNWSVNSALSRAECGSTGTRVAPKLCGALGYSSALDLSCHVLSVGGPLPNSPLPIQLDRPSTARHRHKQDHDTTASSDTILHDSINVSGSGSRRHRSCAHRSPASTRAK